MLTELQQRQTRRIIRLTRDFQAQRRALHDRRLELGELLSALQRDAARAAEAEAALRRVPGQSSEALLREAARDVAEKVRRVSVAREELTEIDLAIQSLSNLLRDAQPLAERLLSEIDKLDRSFGELVRDPRDLSGVQHARVLPAVRR